VSLHGALDLANAKALQAEFIRIEATSVSRIVLDLSELDFIDSTELTTKVTRRQVFQTTAEALEAAGLSE
jgi:hypothetical protein